MLLAVLALAAQVAAEPEVVVRVDPRVELLSAVFRLAGNPEYNQARLPEYAAEVEAHFGELAEHAVVEHARTLRAERGIGFDAVMSLAIHLETGGLELPALEPWPAGLDQRWSVADALAFAAELADFARQGAFEEFARAHAELYALAAARMQEVLDDHARLDWFEGFFGPRGGGSHEARFHCVLGLLNGGANYGPRVVRPDGSEDLYCILGVWLTDEMGAPRFDESVMPTVAHEFCHSYANPLVDAHWAELAAPALAIWPHVEVQMREQAYGDPRTMMREALVRAAVVRYVDATQGGAAAAREVLEQRERGFVWTEGLSDLLADYERERAEGTTLDACMPRIREFFEALPAELAEQAAAAPKAVSMAPANGAQDVDPSTAAFTVTFDRPMRPGSFSFVGGGAAFPEVTGQPSYDAELRTVTLPVRLKPGWSYELSLNGGRFKGFQSAEGVPLTPLRVTFRTRE